MKLEQWSIAVALVLSSIPAVAAQLPMPLRNVFRSFSSYLQNQFVVFFFTFLLFFMLFYSIYAALAQRIKVFQGEQGYGEHAGLSKPGKIFCVALSMLTCLSIFYFTRGKPIQQVLSDTLGPFGIFGGVAIALMTFLLVYMGFHHDIHRGWAFALALFLAGLALVTAGWILAHDNIMWWGYLIAFGALLIGFIGAFIHGLMGRRREGAAEAEPEAERRAREEAERTGRRAPGAGPGPGPGRHGEPGKVGLVDNPIPRDEAATVLWQARPQNEEVTHYVVEHSRVILGRFGRWTTAGRFTYNRPRVDAGLGLPVPNMEGVRQYTVTGLENKATYRFRVAAVNVRGQGAWSREGFCRPQSQRPRPPLRGTPQVVYDDNGIVKNIFIETN